jgi:NAD-dependent deacetylase
MSLTEEFINKLRQIAGILQNCQSVLFITGAGISADSGLPTYRGIGGLYNSKTTDDGCSIEQALSGQMMATQPDICWKYIWQIEKNCRGAKHNPAHEIIAEMEKHFDRLWILTQNIDGFHRSAGSKNVIDIHGDVHKLICTNCSYKKIVEDYSGIQIPPHCPNCASLVRPDVVLFGELLPIEKCQTLRQQLNKGFDIVFSVGTTSVFPYIAGPVRQAKLAGRCTVEINPAETEVSYLVDYKIAAGAAETLEKLWKMYKNAD